MEIPDRLYSNFISYAANITDWYYTNWYSFGYAGHKNTSVPQPAMRAFFGESNDWWMWWKGANYEKGWDVLHQDTIMPYKDVGCDGPTLYRHGDGANFGFYDGHVEYMKKDKVWNDDDWGTGRPGMWSTFNHWPPPPTSKSTCRTRSSSRSYFLSSPGRSGRSGTSSRSSLEGSLLAHLRQLLRLSTAGILDLGPKTHNLAEQAGECSAITLRSERFLS